MRTFKDDEICVRAYSEIDDARRSIARYLNRTYNRKRLHSILGYVPPAEFEEMQMTILTQAQLN